MRSFSVSGAASSVTCKVESGTPVACTSPFTTAALVDGPHELELTAIDSAGNVGQRVAPALGGYHRSERDHRLCAASVVVSAVLRLHVPRERCGRDVRVRARQRRLRRVYKPVHFDRPYVWGLHAVGARQRCARQCRVDHDRELVLRGWPGDRRPIRFQLCRGRRRSRGDSRIRACRESGHRRWTQGSRGAFAVVPLRRLEARGVERSGQQDVRVAVDPSPRERVGCHR